MNPPTTVASARITSNPTNMAAASIQYRAQPFIKLAIVALTTLVHLIAPVLSAPFAFVSSPSLTASQDSTASRHHHQDDDPVADNPLKLTLDILTIAALVVLGGIFAGLTLGLMGLDMVNLQVLASSGSEKERKHASKVLKLLEKGRHWVLVVLLLGNVIVNETLPVFLSDFGGGLAAVLSSTLLIVIFGEIVPQSICARYGLAIGAFCAPMVHATMLILAPIAWPTAKLLDWCLGEEHGTTYRKAELKTFVSLHQQIGTEHLHEDEVTIIRAVLELNDKTVRDVMTPIQDVFIMSSDSILDEQGVARLVRSGYSRVPIHEPGKKDAIVGMLLVKNLIQYDPEDAQAVSSFHLTPLPEASADLTLLDCLNYFQQGRSHMILVSTHPGESRGALGVVTLEDVIEEMIGEEIVDETDIYVDVHNKIKVVRNRQAGNNAGQNWQPLIRGIIERRRKLGGPMKAPLRSSYGTVGIMDNNDGSGTKTHNKYGLPSTSVRAVDKVAIKRPGSPQSVASASRKPSGSYEPNTPLRRESTSSVATSLDGLNSQDLHRAAVINNPTTGSAANSYSEPFIVEVGSQDRTPHIVRISDIQEYPGAEERARKEDERQSRERKQNMHPNGDQEQNQDRQHHNFDDDAERRPLLDGIKKVFGGSD
ncbi:related to MAM3 - Protein required for normal mitochondrial morphology [Melanopsichium pennsylvanicum]|uniref:Related to MAM3 - Protein required for normal mitochondrial morphology n=2 Tax=Melanopsichium pennsylvanicum TaxID=63383 RepID=A0AAJ5C5D8_9BASI|nr:related to MAM3 - Protein required for normal mitochondrial morphology [Melanopsichium pennsylvanicum]